MQIKNEKDLIKVIEETINNNKDLATDFDKLKPFRKDQIIDRMSRVIYDKNTYSFERPHVKVPLTTLGLVYSNSTNDIVNDINSETPQYWKNTSHFNHSYRMYDLILKILATNADELFKSSKKGKELISRLPELTKSVAFMRFVSEVGLANTSYSQLANENRVNGEYFLRKLNKEFSGIIQLEKHTLFSGIGIDLKNTFSPEYFENLKLLSVDNASELFYFTINDLLIENGKEPLLHDELKDLYLFAQILNLNDFFNGKISIPTKNHTPVNLKTLYKYDRSHLILEDPNSDIFQYQIPLNLDCIRYDKSLVTN